MKVNDVKNSPPVLKALIACYNQAAMHVQKPNVHTLNNLAQAVLATQKTIKKELMIIHPALIELKPEDVKITIVEPSSTTSTTTTSSTTTSSPFSPSETTTCSTTTKGTPS